MTKEKIKEKATEIAEEQQQRGFEKKDIYPCSFTAAMEMAEWMLQNIKIVTMHNAYNHDLFENRKFICIEEQKRQLLLSLKKYIKVEEETTDYGTIVKMAIKVMQ